MTTVSRRSVLKLGASGLASLAFPCVLQGNDWTDAKPAGSANTKLTGLLHNEDSTAFFGQDFPAGRAGEVVDRYVDVLASAGVSVLLCNTNARRTNYRSKVWEAYWDGYDPSGPDDQPFLASLPADRRKGYRRLVGNMLELDRQGVDYPARVIQRCRHRGISPWISLRMNDVHENDNLEHPFHSAICRKPELFRQGHPGYFARALDYAHPEVRDHYKALIAETLERYDIAGLELDFLREPYLFSKGKEQEGRRLLTEWMRGVRALADRAASTRGHAVKLGVRVPSCPDTAIGLGLGAPAWAKQGLVDLIVPAPRWRTLEFAMPLRKWRELVGDRVTLAGGLEAHYCPAPNATARPVTCEEAVGAAVAVLTGGADVVYLFNYFQNSHPKWPLPEYQRILKSFSSLAELEKLPRRHAVTFRDVTIPGEDYRAPLPATGTKLCFALPLGPSPLPDWQAEAEIEIGTLPALNTPPTVSINGIVGNLRSTEAAKNGSRLLRYGFPLTALSGKNRDTVVVAAANKEPLTVTRVEISLRPRS